MMKILRLEAPHPRDGNRWTIGVLVSSECDRVTAALVSTVGSGIRMRPNVVEALTTEVPPETKALFSELACSTSTPADFQSAGRITSLRAQLAEIEALAIEDLLARSATAQNRLLAIGVHDPGLWSCGKSMPGGYLGLCDAARLAELTDANVIDAFPARDVARGGQGGPITALPEWIVLRSSDRNRALLHLGSSVRMSYLPRDSGGNAAARLLSFEVGPGMQLLDRLTHRLTQGEHRFDPGGRFAVQGRRIPELLAHWLADPCFRRPLPRWQPRGIRPERFLIDAVQMAVEAGWSVRDLLCTATHLIAESIPLAIGRFLSADVAIEEVLLTGGGQHNGLLLSEIAGRLGAVPITKIGQYGRSGEMLGPACIALLALLHLDQVPVNYPAVTGTEAPRVLGRLTPGSAQSWQRLLAEVARATPTVRPLRAAV